MIRKKMTPSKKYIGLLITLILGTCLIGCYTTPAKATDEWIPVTLYPSTIDVSTINQIYITVTINTGTPCFKVNWGNITREGCVLWANSETWKWGGYCIQVIPPPLSHTYEVGYLEPGYYTFTFKVWGKDVKTIYFSVPPPTQTVPSIPQNLQAIPGNSQVILNWQAPSSNGGSAITNYKIYRGAPLSSETYFITVANVLTYTDTGLTNGQLYHYKVSAVNGVGEGPLSNEVIAIPATVPTAPQNLQATGGKGQITLTWQAPFSNSGSAITNYKIYRGSSSDCETYFTTVGNVRTYTDTGLTNGQPYYYKVSAVNGVGEGSLANEVNATPATGPITLTSVLPNPSNGLTTITATNASNNVNANGILANVSTPSGGWLYPVMTYVESNQWIGTFTVASDGVYTVRINATETSGGTTYAGPMSITGAITAPTAAAVTSPPAGSYLKGMVTITATGTDALGIKNITFWIGSPGTGTLIGSDTVSPYSINWNTATASDGAYLLYIRVFDNAGNYLDSGGILVTVDNTLPTTVTITLPTAGAYVKGTTVITAIAADNPGGSGVRNATFYRDAAVLLGTATTFPYSYDWSTVGLDGAHTLYVRVFDKAGNYLDSAVVAITVDNTPPSAASVTAPISGMGVGGTIWINATTTDILGIKNVSFYRDAAVLIGTDMAAPYAISWNTTIVANGNHTIYVRAFDNAGNYRDSLNILIIVNNTSLIITIPTAPQNLQASLGNGYINLIWQAPSNSGGLPIINYKIYRGTSPGNETYLVTINNISSFTDTNAIKGQPYYYRVSAVNAMGESPWSAEVIAIIYVTEKGDQTFNLILIILLGALILGISGYFIHYGRKIKILNDRIAQKSIKPLGKKGAKPKNWFAVDSSEIEDQIEHLPVSAEEKEVILTELHGLEKDERIEVYNSVSGNLPENEAEILWNSLIQRFERLYKMEKWNQALLLLEQLFEIAEFLGDQNKVNELSLKYEEIQEKNSLNNLDGINVW